MAEFKLVTLTPADAERGQALSQSVGWGHTVATWKRRLIQGKTGNFGLLDGDKLVASSLTTLYGQERAWISLVITHADYQRQGLSSQLMRVTLDYLQKQNIREIMLDASVQGRPVYERLGFRALGEVGVWYGQGGRQDGTKMPPLTYSLLPKMIQYDAGVFGVARPMIFSQHQTEFPDLTWVDRDPKAQAIKGFIMAEEDTNGWAHIGPWEHTDPAGAEALLRTALNALDGLKVYMQIPSEHTAAREIVSRYGLTYQRFCTRMILGDTVPAPGNPSAYYAVGSYAIG